MKISAQTFWYNDRRDTHTYWYNGKKYTHTFWYNDKWYDIFIDTIRGILGIHM